MIFFILEKVDELYRKWFPPEFDCYHLFIWTTEHKFNARFEALKHAVCTGCFAIFFAILLIINYFVIPTPILEAGDAYTVNAVFVRLPDEPSLQYIEVDTECQEEIVDYLSGCRKRGGLDVRQDCYIFQGIPVYIELDPSDGSDRFLIRTGKDGTVRRENRTVAYRLMDGETVAADLEAIIFSP